MDTESQPHSSKTDKPKEDGNTSGETAKGNVRSKQNKKLVAGNKQHKRGTKELLQERIVEKKFISCKECGRPFPRLQSLERHQKIHLGIGLSFTCYECGKQFNAKPSLKAHQKTHQRETYGVRTMFKTKKNKGKVML